MKAAGIDERYLRGERLGSNFLVFIYESGNYSNTSWSVDSYLLTDTDLPRVLSWLGQHLPVDACWALGVVRDPRYPTVESQVDVDWVVGGDILNIEERQRSPEQHRLAAEMLARRDTVTLT
jgi:hypothetical protein